jgi:hypothetical protein
MVTTSKSFPELFFILLGWIINLRHNLSATCMILRKKNQMATIQSNMLTSSLSGSIGHIVFRQLRGKTIVANKPKEIKKQSEQQRENRRRFKHAAAWAKGQMLDENKKAHYWRIAKKLKLPNAYTAAVCDYMREGEIKEVDTRHYKGRAGDMIRMKITKKDLAVKSVEVSLRDDAGNVIEKNLAIRKDKNVFIYKATTTIAGHRQVHLRVSITDPMWNTVKKEMVMPLT